MKIKNILMIILIINFYLIYCNSKYFGRNLSYITVTDTTDKQFNEPKIASLNSQGYVVVWWSTERYIYGQLFDQNGKVGSNFLIRASLGCDYRASVAASTTGDFYVAFSDYSNSCSSSFSSSDNYLRIYKYSSNGTKDSLEFDKLYGTSAYVKWTSIAVLSDGKVAVCVISTLNYFNYYVLDSQTFNMLVEICGTNCNTFEKDRCEIRALSGGKFLIVYDECTNGNSPSLYAYVMNNDGTIFKSLLPSENLQLEQWRANAAVLSNGGFVITWDGIYGSNNRWHVLARIYDTNYDPIGNAFQVDTLIDNSEYHHPSVTALSTGGFMIAFHNRQDSNWDIYIKEYTSSGSAVDTNEKIANTYTTGTQYNPSITSVNNERYVFVYESELINILHDKASDIENTTTCTDFSLKVLKDTATLINFSSNISSTVMATSNLKIKIKTLPSSGTLIKSTDNSNLEIDSIYDNNVIKYSPSTTTPITFTFQSIDTQNRLSNDICTVTMTVCYPSCDTCSVVGDSTDHKCTLCLADYYAPVDKTTDCYHLSTSLVGYYFDTDKFSKCSSNCLSCTSNTECTNCDDTYFVSNENSTKICKSCILNCKTCPNDSQCTVCNSGFYVHLVDNYCYLDCPEGYFKDNNSSPLKCGSCSENCKICSDSSTCTTCFDTFYFHLVNSTCHSICPNGYYGDPSDMKCKICMDTCETCADATTCKSCIAGKYLYNNNCVTSCPAQTFTDEINRKCVNCSSNCLSCTGDTVCTICQESYFLTSNKDCLPCMANCKTCTNQNECSICNSGFYLHLVDKDCYSECPDGYFENNSLSPIQCGSCMLNCKDCTNSTECIKCKSSFYFYETDKSCYTKCPNGFYGDSFDMKCKQCSSGCEQCSSSTNCEKCSSGQYSLNGNCLVNCPGKFYPDNVKMTCLSCTTYCSVCSDANSCTTCDAGYFYNSADGKCYQKCPTGYFGDPNNYLCKPCISNCIECSNTTECLKCGNNYYLNSVNKLCVTSCPASFYLDLMIRTCIVCPITCSTCTNETTCSVCKTGYFLFDNFCTNSCPPGYFTDTNELTCKLCPLNCKICTSTKCTTCNDSFFLHNLDNKCYQTCPSTYYGNTSTKSCQSCISNCLTCPNATDCTKCGNNMYVDSVTKGCVSSCSTGFYLEASIQTCKACPSSCATCLDFTLCDTCKTNYFLHQNGCVSSCPDFYYLDLASTSCMDCPLNCRKCSNGNQCTTCDDGFFLYSLDKGCYEICPSGYYGNTVSKTCQTCVTNCAECPNATDCSKCATGYLLNIQTKKCITVCPDGFFLDILTKRCVTCPVYYLEGTSTCVTSCASTYYLDAPAKTCRKCLANCENCLNGTECILCSTDYFNLDKEECQTSKAGYYGDEQSRKWLPCPEICTMCSSPTVCTQCKTNYFLLNDNPNQCGTCPTGYYGDTVSKKCEACIDNCSICENKTECIQCNQGFITFEKQCLSRCKDGYYYNENISNCSKCNTVCSKCKNNSDYCVQCSGTSYSFTQIIPYDEIFDQCLPTCPDGYYPDDKRSCQRCKTKWKFLMNNNCVDFCNQGYYKDREVFECVLCNKPGEFKYLDSCVKECPSGNVIFTNNLCIKTSDCPAGYFIETQTRKCIPCPVYFLDGTNTCVDECPISFYLDSLNKKCKKCLANCDLCTNATECDLCSLNYYNLNKDECKTSLDGYYGINETRKWSPCPQNCKACPNSNICSQCFSPYFLTPDDFTTCGTCPFKYYGDTSSHKCETCVENCESCENNIECLICSKGFLNYQKLCLTSCMDGFYENKELSTCSKCKRVCAKCKNNSDYCIQCADKTFTFKQTQPFDGIYIQCLTTCPDKYYPDQNNECRTCENQGKFLMIDHCVSVCDKGYYKNMATFECIICDQPNEYKYEDKCVKSCPENFIVDYNQSCTPLICNGECKNGGKCYVKDNKINCICSSIYSGEFCEIELPITIDKLDLNEPLTTNTLKYISDLKYEIENNLGSFDPEQTKKITDISIKQVELVNSGKIEANPEILNVLSTSLLLNLAATNIIEKKETIPLLKKKTSILVDSIVKNNIVKLKQSFVYKSPEISVIVTESLEQNIQKMNAVALLNNLSIVNSTECEQAIKEKHKLPSTISLIVKKVEFNRTIDQNDEDERINSNSLVYELIDQNTRMKYNVDVCKDLNVTVSNPLPKQFLNINTYKKLSSSNLDMINLKSSAFHNQCIYVKDPNTDQDTTLKYRIKNFYLNRTIECATNCNYGGVDDYGYAICNCKGLNDKEHIPQYLVKTHINSKDLEVNSIVLRCFTKVVIFPDLLNNPGFFIGFLVLVLGLIYYTTRCGECEDLIEMNLDKVIKYDCRYVETENKDVHDLIGGKQVENNDHEEDSSLNKENKKGKDINVGFDGNKHKVNNKSDLSIPVTSRIYEDKSYVNQSEFNEVSIRTNSVVSINKKKKNKFNNIKGKQIPVEDSNNFEKIKFKENKNSNSLNNLQPKFPGEKLQIITKKDYNSISPYTAIDKDNRKFLTMLFDYFVEEHVLFRLIFKKSILNPSSVEIFLLTFRIFVMFGFNAILFSERYIDERTAKSGDEGISIAFTREIVKTVLSLVFTILFTSFFNILTFPSKNNQDHFNNALISRKKNYVMKSFKKLEDSMRCKFFFFIIITYGLKMFFWAYMISFCGVFPSMAYGWVYGSIATLILDWFGLSILVPFIRTILRTFMKKIKFLANIEYLFWITKNFRR